MTQTFKLTKDMRATIAARVLAGRFDEQDKKLHDRFQKLAEDCYTRQYRGKHLALIESLPDNWLVTDDDIKVQLGGQVLQLQFNGNFPRDSNCNRVRATVHKPFPNCDRYQCRLAVEADDPLTKRYDALSFDLKEYQEQRKVLSHEVEGVLASCNTSAQLLTAWPEIAQFMADIIPVAKAPGTALAPIAADLNKRLGIKPLKKAA